MASEVGGLPTVVDMVPVQEFATEQLPHERALVLVELACGQRELFGEALRKAECQTFGQS